MELITLIIFGLFILVSNFIGYKMGKGEMIDLIPKRFKPVIRTGEQEDELIEKLMVAKGNKR